MEIDGSRIYSILQDEDDSEWKDDMERGLSRAVCQGRVFLAEAHSERFGKTDVQCGLCVVDDVGVTSDKVAIGQVSLLQLSMMNMIWRSFSPFLLM